jgi:hypothetical protein
MTFSFAAGACGSSCDRNCRITHVARGGQAALAGVQVGMKMLRINGKDFHSTLPLALLGGDEDWVDGEAEWQKDQYEITYEQTTKANKTDHLEAYVENAIKSLRSRLQQFHRCGVEQKCDLRANDEIENFFGSSCCVYKRTSSCSTTCDGISALPSYSTSSESVIDGEVPLTAQRIAQLVSFGLTEISSGSFALSESDRDAASYCAMTDHSSSFCSSGSMCEMYCLTARPSTNRRAHGDVALTDGKDQQADEDLCAMYDGLDVTTKEDLCAMYDGLDVVEVRKVISHLEVDHSDFETDEDTILNLLAAQIH